MRIALAVLVASVAVSAGEKPVAGPPWKTSWPEARKEALARVLGKGPAFPRDWTSATREALVAAWQARLGKAR